ncbi:MAG: amidohydrolase family protein [Thermoanaerobaculia bacterium]|nr:amidohydrolase family protein [Thermoanaerobaculia bacterium]
MKHRAHVLTVAFTTLSLLLGAPALSAKKAEKKPEKEAEKPAWDVEKPPGEQRTVNVDTNDLTWSSLDVSPDGRTIVFDMLGDLYTVAIEGGEAKPLTQSVAWDLEPRFSPDGKQIAFISDRAGADNLWLMQADGTKPRALSSEKEHLVHNPAWSPDGEYVVAKKDYTSTRSIPSGEIWLFHVSGGDGLQLIERPDGPQSQKNIAEPAFSRDGRYVYYSQDTTPGRVWQYNKDSTGQIFVIRRLDRETGEIEDFVTGPGGAIRPTPSPDGRHLAFVKRTSGFTSAIYLKDLATGNENAIYDHLDRDLQETDGSQGNTPAFAWTPDAKSIVFWAGGKIRRIDVASKQTAVIPVHVKTALKVTPALRFPVAVAPETFPVRMLRWAQRSPDGQKAFYQALGVLWSRDLAGGEPRRLTTQTDHFELYPATSRDGQSVVYVSWDDQELGRVRIVPAGGGEGRVIIPEPGLYVEPKLSPDGSKVVYRKLTGGYLLSGEQSLDPGLYLIDAAGGEPKLLSKSGFEPHFGATSERVFFGDLSDETTLVLKSVDLEGHDERTHLSGDSLTEFSVSPDGRWVAFIEQYNAHVAPFVFTGKTVEIGPKTTSIPVRQVSKRAGEFLHWSADSKALSWSHGATLYTRQLSDAFSHLEGAPETLPEPVETGLDLGFTTAADRPAGQIALVGARVVTMRDAKNQQEVIEDGVVLVDRDRIVAVGKRGEIQVPPGATTIDVTGKTILPGLVDVHAHGSMASAEITPQQNWLRLADLAFGVTTIHDPSNDSSEIFSAAELQRAGKILSPRVFSTGTILYGAQGPGYKAVINSYDDALFHVRRLKELGAISVKSYQQPRRDQRQQIIAAARELGIMVVPEGGAKIQHNLTEIVDGHTGIEHAVPIVTGYSDMVQLWSQTQVGYTPTLGVAYGGLSGENYWYDRTEVWKDEHLMRFTPRFVVEPRAIRRTTAPDEHYNHIRVAQFAKQLRDQGVSVQLGAHGQRAGLAAHWEMWMLEQGGFSPWEALRAATIDGAWYVGLDKDLGSLEKGKLADLFIVDGNPLEKLRGSENVVYTMLGGRLYDATTMNQLAPDKVEREELFFEREGGDTIHPATTKRVEDFARRHGWVH